MYVYVYDFIVYMCIWFDICICFTLNIVHIMYSGVYMSTHSYVK